MSTKAPIAVGDLDLFSDEVLLGPYATYATLRETAQFPLPKGFSR